MLNLGESLDLMTRHKWVVIVWPGAVRFPTSLQSMTGICGYIEVWGNSCGGWWLSPVTQYRDPVIRSVKSEHC